MIEMEVTIQREDGFHARPASEFVKIANKYRSTIYIKRNEKLISGKSILNLMSLALGKGEKLALSIDGEDEEQALEELLGIL
ncbi:HPr family phosphocarrier protein [Geosporobacter ferrireducens]|uniref:Phosphocarrier protein HPr n=1 Tax=Geosporobacter ferrireducens TaxID=1424294 RepID=A0A1D8GK53_9FIRM|nr:HPr family phosphocarrier protein [Geosporobacter ferrireducens]AOT71288.1 hypothetical protein Gferi_18035 [Geosporobacter ferrireducens]MTI58102.1 HPr family phosphocarrier protein [Geosporobacter ferrireducens]